MALLNMDFNENPADNFILNIILNWDQNNYDATVIVNNYML